MVRECKEPSAPGEVPEEVFSDGGSTPPASTIHSHNKWEINRSAPWPSFACHGALFICPVGDLNLLLKIIDRFQIVLYNWGTAKI